MSETKNMQSRLTRQLASKGVSGGAGIAIAQMKKLGQMNDDGSLTAKGKERQAMGASGRAKDRAAKASGNNASDYKYDAKTNSATLKVKK